MAPEEAERPRRGGRSNSPCRRQAAASRRRPTHGTCPPCCLLRSGSPPQLLCASQSHPDPWRFRDPSIRALPMARLCSPAHEGSRGVGAPSTRRLSDGRPGNMRAHPPIEPASDRTEHTIRNPLRRHGPGYRGDARWRDSYTVPSRRSAKRRPASRRASATTAMPLLRRRQRYGLLSRHPGDQRQAAAVP